MIAARTDDFKHLRAMRRKALFTKGCFLATIMMNREVADKQIVGKFSKF